MEHIEEDLRFRYVRLFGCYNSILQVAFAGVGIPLSGVPDVPLFLEVGGSSGTMVNMMALGLSRTTAEALADHATNKDMSVDELKGWLRTETMVDYNLSPICLRELETLRQRL
jgi:hypothetical protein